jgi:predicted O-methyltransferase YrrM
VTTLVCIAIVLQVATLGIVLAFWRRQKVQFDRVRHVIRTENRRLAEDGKARLKEELRKLREDVGKRAHKAALATGQQMEWRAHLATLLDWPPGALPATRHWAASPDLLVHLATLVRERRPEMVVECGGGVSTLVIARALQMNGRGRLHTLESDTGFAALTQERLARLALQDVVRIHVAPLEPLPGEAAGNWYALGAVGRLPERIDMLFVDGPQVGEDTSRAPAIDRLFPRLSERGFAVFDDARRSGEASFPALVASGFPHLRKTDLPAEKGAMLFAPE